MLMCVLLLGSRSVTIPLLPWLSLHQSIKPASVCFCLPVCVCVCWLVDSINAYEILVPGHGAWGEALMERQVAVWVIGLPVPEGDSGGGGGGCVLGLGFFKPHSQQANTLCEQCAMEMIKANGFSSTRVCCWTSKVHVFRIYKCEEVQAGSTVESGHTDMALWSRAQNYQLSTSTFLNNHLSHNCNTINHIVASRMQFVLFPSALSHCAYLAG